MTTHNANKRAWEEAFDNKKEDFGNDIIEKIQQEKFPFLEPVLIETLNEYDLKDKKIAQFCCNNGRELLALMHTGASFGVGFDIAENMVTFANEVAQILEYDCTFISTDILEIDSSHDGQYDAIFITIGALTWFKDLDLFFDVVSRCLKKGGTVFINECHPLTNMLAMYGEPEYNSNNLNQIVHSYFKSDPWIEVGGIDYLSDQSKKSVEVFTSYSHTLSTIINSLIKNHLRIVTFIEIDQDISGSFTELNQNGFPLSYLLTATK